MMFVAKAHKATNKVTTVPAPIGGLNARDSLAAMPATDAIIMRNVWPQPYGCSVRKGYAKHVNGLIGEVSSLAVWHSETGTQKMFAWADTAVIDVGICLFEVTACGTLVPADALLVDLVSSVWQTASLSNSAGSHLIAVSGADAGILYNTSGVQSLIAGGGIVANTWAGLNPINAIQLTVHQGRLWAVEKNTSFGWYLPVGAIYGTLVKFDFGPLFAHGGFLQFLATWTLDDGNGAEDHLVAMSSTGDVVVYGGTDPTSDTTWSLVGVYFAGAPVSGRRSYAKVGGDLVVITQRGVVSLTSLLASTKVNQDNQVVKSSKIQYLVSAATSDYSDLAGWELAYAPSYNMLILNVPTTVFDGNFQLVSNEIMPEPTWTQFSGIDAASWAVFNHKLYFGDYLGGVYEAWTGNLDNQPSVCAPDPAAPGDDISFEVQQAYSYLNAPSIQKQVSMYRPNFLTTGVISYASKIDYDFSSLTLPPLTSAPIGGGSSSRWGASLWDTGIWGGGLTTDRIWSQAQGTGVAMSVHIAGAVSTELLWVSTDYSYRQGSLL